MTITGNILREGGTICKSWLYICIVQRLKREFYYFSRIQTSKFFSYTLVYTQCQKTDEVAEGARDK